MQAFLFNDVQLGTRNCLQMFAGGELARMFAECLQSWMASKNQRNLVFRQGVVYACLHVVEQLCDIALDSHFVCS
jgi:hypothetical protein